MADFEEEESPDLLVLVYGELRRLAGQLVDHEGPGLSLDPTALVHEAWLRLEAKNEGRWESRSHFAAVAARAMRRVLVDRARRQKRERHGGGRERVELGSGLVAVESSTDYVALDSALTKLEAAFPRAAEVVNCRVFAALSVEETAVALQVSEPTVKREWRFARAWLTAALEDQDLG